MRIDAAVQPHLITATTRFQLAPTSILQRKSQLPPQNTSALPYTQKCVAAIGFAEGYPLFNDKCVLTRWRPGEAWRFDAGLADVWQVIQVGPQHDPYCMAVDIADIPKQVTNTTFSDKHARVIVNRCQGLQTPGNNQSGGIQEQALWRIVPGLNGTFWFRNMRNKLCLQALDTKDEFRMGDCVDVQSQKFTLQQAKPA